MLVESPEEQRGVEAGEKDGHVARTVGLRNVTERRGGRGGVGQNGSWNILKGKGTGSVMPLTSFALSITHLCVQLERTHTYLLTGLVRGADRSYNVWLETMSGEQDLEIAKSHGNPYGEGLKMFRPPTKRDELELCTRLEASNRRE